MDFIETMGNVFIRPQRMVYEVTALGPKTVKLGTRTYEREDLELCNPRGMRLQCSWFQPLQSERKKKRLPVIVYLHGNGGSRMDSYDCLDLVTQYSATLFCFDFCGSGLSEGDYVSLGKWEQEDVRTVVLFLQSTFSVSNICLWGRSMGAATSILYSSKYPDDISCIILDSPFASLKRLAYETSSKMEINFPKFLFSGLVGLGLTLIDQYIYKKAGFYIAELEPIAVIKKCTMPALFVHAADDLLIHSQHSLDLYKEYTGTKNIVFVIGNHNSLRTKPFFIEASNFLHQHLLSEDDKYYIPKPIPIIDSSFAPDPRSIFYCKKVNVEKSPTIGVSLVLVLSSATFTFYTPFTNQVYEEIKVEQILAAEFCEDYFYFEVLPGEYLEIFTKYGKISKTSHSAIPMRSAYFYSIEVNPFSSSSLSLLTRIFFSIVIADKR